MCVRFLASDLLDHAVSSLKVGRRRELEHERGQVPLMRRDTIAYRRAFERKQKQANQDFWLMGAYVYQAITRAAPLLIPFNKNPKAEPYLDKPFPLYEEDYEDAESKAVEEKGLAYMFSQMQKINAKFGYKE